MFFYRTTDNFGNNTSVEHMIIERDDLLPVYNIMCFSTHFFRDMRPWYVTIENIVEYLLEQKKKKSNAENRN